MTHKNGSLTLAATLSVLISTGLAGATTANAQVEVDLSVLDGAMDATTTPPVSRSGLKMPGASFPKSTYFGPPVTVAAPEPAPVMSAPEPAPEPAPVPEPVIAAPEPAPEPEPVAVAEPEPAPEPEPTVEAAATPEPVASASDAPPPPPEPEELAVTPTPSAPEEEPAAPEPAAVTEPAPETQVVSTGDQAVAGDTRITFEGEDTRLPESAKGMLDPLASQAAENDDIRIQLRAYAGGEDVSASKARRLSLSRALAVRSYLIEQGVRSTRIDVRALGDKSDEDPINRVDIEVGTP